MCRSGEEGGRRCADHRRLQSRPIDELRPDSASDRPELEWANDAASSPEQLYREYPQEVAGLVVEMMATAKEQEAEMTSDVLETLPDGARMHGLEFRVKSPESLARKLYTKFEADSFADLHETAGRITDVVRYTTISGSDQVVAAARTTVDRLTERGWTVIEVEQPYVDGNQYKGLHMLARHTSGRVAEFQFQFHTEESQRIKDDTHVDYEAARNPRLPDSERAALIEKMTAVWAQVPAPAGLAELTELGGCQVRPKVYAPPRTNRGRDTQ